MSRQASPTRPVINLREYQTFLHTNGFGGRPKPLNREQVRAGRELRMAFKAEGVKWPNCVASPKEYVFLPKLNRTYVRFSNGRVELACHGRHAETKVKKAPSIVQTLVDGLKS